jgi:hypothetical protein
LGDQPAELAVLELISNLVDRREDLQAACDSTKPDQVRTRIALATQIRLIEAGIERLLRRVNTDMPQEMSITSLKAQRAVNTRRLKIVEPEEGDPLLLILDRTFAAAVEVITAE